MIKLRIILNFLCLFMVLSHPAHMGYWVKWRKNHFYIKDSFVFFFFFPSQYRKKPMPCILPFPERSHPIPEIYIYILCWGQSLVHITAMLDLNLGIVKEQARLFWPNFAAHSIRSKLSLSLFNWKTPFLSHWMLRMQSLGFVELAFTD